MNRRDVEGAVPYDMVHIGTLSGIEYFRVMNMERKINFKLIIPAILLPLAVGALAAYITKGDYVNYESLYKPLFSPPGMVFGFVWTILYVLMGYGSYRVLVSEASKARKSRALKAYALQLGLNFLWPIIFFKLQMYWTAFIWALLLLLAVWVCQLLFAHIDTWAGRVFVPYLLWCGYAVYLSLGIALLN